MNFNPVKLLEYMGSLASGSEALAKSWRAVLVASGLVGWLSVGGIIIYSFWEGRESLAEKAFLLFSSRAAPTMSLAQPWFLVPIESFPEFWVCSKKSCEPDYKKQKAVQEVLEKVRGEQNAVRSVYAVYGDSYRRLAAQTKNPRQRVIGQELWIIPLTQSGYSENIKQHERGLCNTIRVSELEEGSILRIEAPLYNLVLSKNCPIDQEDVPYQVKGYIAMDFDEMPTDLPKVELSLRQAAEEIEVIMGYDTLPGEQE